MKFKKKKYRFTPPDQVVRRAEAAMHPPQDSANFSNTGGLPADEAERLLHTVELNRAELLQKLAASKPNERPSERPQTAVTADAGSIAQTGGLPADEAERRLHTVEINRAELLRRLSQTQDIPAPPAAEPARADEANHPKWQRSSAPPVAAPAIGEPPVSKPTPTAKREEKTAQVVPTVPSGESAPALSPKKEVQDTPAASVREAAPELPPCSKTARSPEEEASRAALLCDLSIQLRALLKRKESEPVPFFKRLFSPPNLAFAALAAAFLLPIFLFAHGDKSLYYIHENDKLAAVVYTDSDDYADIFASGGLALDAADDVSAESLGSTTHLTVTRSYAVTVTADGETHSLNVLGHTVAQALDQLGIAVGENDLVEPAPDTVLVENDAVVVRRVTYEERTVTEDVAWQEVTKPSPLIREGRTQVMNAGGGRDGVATRTYRDTYIDGALAETEMISEYYDTLPWNVVTLEGDDDAWMSPIDGSQFTDIPIVDNAPADYEWVMENGVCTAYSFKPGTFGASGMRMFQGFVAVNTNVIPYGSLLFITSPSGEFTYGWAIAADVGLAMMAGYVDIDLFFETYTESALFGKHSMNVYVVKQLTQGELEQYAAVEGMFRNRVPATTDSEG